MPSEIVEEILNEPEDQSYKDNAHLLAEKKLRILLKRNFDNHQLSSKLSSFLYSKGYDYDTINEVVNKLVKKIDVI